MRKYSEDSPPEPFGLQNSNSICYFNSTLQTLLSCSSLLEMLNSSNLFVESIKNLLGSGKNNMNCWNCLNTELLSQRISNFTLGNQNCVAECLNLAIQCMPKDIQELFYHRLAVRQTCETCGLIFSERIETDVIFKFNSHSVSPSLIKIQKSELDIKCPQCEKNKVMIYSATMVPEILAIMFLDIHGDCDRVDIPEIIKIEGRNGTLNYRAVSYINHYGSQAGGHYVAYCRRKGKWYMLNDVYISESQFSPDKNTYMIIYHYT
jgi:ubiquitin C-terminal hydrolase